MEHYNNVKMLHNVQQIFSPELVVIPLYKHLLSSKLYIVTGAKTLWDILSHMWSLGYSCYTYKKKKKSDSAVIDLQKIK